jgi:cytochrome c553
LAVPASINKRFKRWTVSLLGLGIAGVILALLVAYSGIYNVAASKGHPLWLDWFLRTGMRHSVLRHSSGIMAPQLDPDWLPVAASHYHNGCGRCHGTPDKHGNPVYRNMLPTPPELARQVAEWSDANLFWIVRHGLQYAGMPSWSGAFRDDEVWAMVAFLRKLPELGAAEYLALSAGNSYAPSRSAQDIVAGEDAVLHMTACERCHESDDASPTSPLVPRLSGQSQPYLENALRDYRSGERQSGFMEPVAALLSDTDISGLANLYATRSAIAAEGLSPPDAPSAVARGETLAKFGQPDDDIPPCDSCHSANALAIYPRLGGLSQTYLKNQLRLWKTGLRRETATERLMDVIASRLSDEQIAAVSAYYASLKVTGQAAR